MGLHQPIWTIPPFETGFQIAARLAYLARPKENLTVSQWAVKYLKYYDPEILPFLNEIMDACSDPETSEVGDMGPAQGGKSMVGEAFIGWSIHQSPMPFMMVQPDKAAAEAFVKTRINAMLAAAPVLKAELLPSASADNMHLKLFRSMYLGCAWPVKSQFRQRTYGRGWADDFDAMPEDVEGEGDVVFLLDGRFTIHKGRDTKLISSSPAREKGGIEDFVVRGSDERLQPVCPSCEDRIELDLIRDLKFDDSGTTDQASETAHVICPANGCLLDPEDRHALLTSLRGLPNRGFVAANAAAGKYRRTFRRDGLLSFTPWPALARQWREANIAWETRQDESQLKTFYNTKAGKNYRSKLSGEKPVESKELKSRMEDHWAMGQVPRGPKVIQILVDVQHDRFECAAIGTAAGRETWFIERFAIHVLDDGLTGVQPFLFKEHWKALLPLFDRKYPMIEAGPGGADARIVSYAPVLGVTVDTGGSDKSGDQATEGAKYFFTAARALGVHERRITLIKGGSNPKGELMPPGKFADQKVRGGAKRSSARLWIPNVHKIKNMVDARLRRGTPGPGYLHLPGDFPDEYLDELTAEELKDGKWQKIRTRNETWDHLVYNEATLLKPGFAGSQSHMRWIPKGFGVIWPPKGETSLAVLPLITQQAPATVPEPLTKAAPAAPNPQRAQRRMIRHGGGNWLKNRRS